VPSTSKITALINTYLPHSTAVTNPRPGVCD
jgi:hypothetical protein